MRSPGPTSRWRRQRSERACARPWRHASGPWSCCATTPSARSRRSRWRWAAVRGRSAPRCTSRPAAATAANRVYLPFLGPGSANAGLEVVTASTGHPERHVHGGFPPNTFAQAPDGTVYELGGDNATVSLAAVGPNGVVRWTRSLRVQRGAQTNVLVGS